MLLRDRAAIPIDIAYEEIQALEPNLSTSAKSAIWIGVGMAALVAVLAVAISGSDVDDLESESILGPSGFPAHCMDDTPDGGANERPSPCGFSRDPSCGIVFGPIVAAGRQVFHTRQPRKDCEAVWLLAALSG